MTNNPESRVQGTKRFLAIQAASDGGWTVWDLALSKQAASTMLIKEEAEYHASELNRTKGWIYL